MVKACPQVLLVPICNKCLCEGPAILDDVSATVRRARWKAIEDYSQGTFKAPAADDSWSCYPACPTLVIG